jgi:3D (Asp-Asp-Asp) domain-containing protein
MPVIAVVALMGLMFLPGNATAPGHAIASSTPAVTSIAADGDPSKRLAVSTETASESLTVGLTSYNAVPSQTDGDPSVTASGLKSNPEVIIARSRDLASELPFGTVVKLERSAADSANCGFDKVEHLIGYRVVGDTMNERFTNKLDVLFDQTDTVSVSGVEMNPSRAMGYCGQVTATVVGRVDLKNVPATQQELAAAFTAPSLAKK